MTQQNELEQTKNIANVWNISGWIFGLIVFAIGVLNVVLVHPVLGLVALLLSVLYFPPVNALLEKFGFRIPLFIKIILGIFIIWFTSGVSDLGDMID